MNRFYCVALSTAFAGLFSTVAQAQTQSVAPSSPQGSAISKNYGKLPLSFEPNRGQTDARVQFVARGAGYTVYLSPTSATFALENNAVVRMDLAGARSHGTMQSEDKLGGVASYMLGSSRITNLPTYAQASSHDVYPGIDLVYHGTRGQLEYDFVLAPKADPSKIRLKFAGAQPIVDDASGDLVLSPTVRFRKPVVYQQAQGVRRPVSGSFRIASNKEVSFRVGQYDRAHELIIDPALVYSSYLGGSTQQSVINAMAVNAYGEIYVTGVTNALDYPTTRESSRKTARLVTRTWAPTNAVRHLRRLPLSRRSAPTANPSSIPLTSGAAEQVVPTIPARQSRWMRPTMRGWLAERNPTISRSPPMPSSLFATRWRRDSTSAPSNTPEKSAAASATTPIPPSWSTSTLPGPACSTARFLGGSGDVHPAQIALDSSGNIFVAGSAYTANVGPQATVFANDGQFNYPTSASAFQPIVIGGSSYSAFVTELAPDGKSLIYSTMFSAPNQNTYNNALAVNAGKIFIGGYTQDPHLPTTTGALSHTCVERSNRRWTRYGLHKRIRQCLRRRV